MESNGIKGKIHCSQSSKELLQTAGYSFEDRGDIPVKGKGTMRTFWLTGIPTGSARVVKRAVEAAKQALEELKLDRAGAETSSDDDGAAKARKVPLWDRGRRRSRGMYIDEDDKNRTQVLRQAIETGMKKTASVLDFVSLEQDASGSFTGKSLIDGKRRSPVRQSCFDRASSEEGDASAAVMSVEVCACAPDALMLDCLDYSRRFVSKSLRTHNKPQQDIRSKFRSRTARGNGRGSGRDRKHRSASARREEQGVVGDLYAASGGEDDETEEEQGPMRSRRLGPEEAAKLLAGGAKESPVVIVEQRTIRLADQTGLAPYTMTGLHVDLTGMRSAPAESQPQGRETRSTIQRASAPEEQERSARVESMVQAFRASSSTAATQPKRCPFGFDLLAAAADDLLQGGAMRRTALAVSTPIPPPERGTQREK
jgi:hypothetical protein